MNRKTVIKFCGSLLNDMPEIIEDSYKISNGDVGTAIKSVIQILTEMSSIVSYVKEKQNTELFQYDCDEEERLRGQKLIEHERELQEKNKEIIEERLEKVMECNHIATMDCEDRKLISDITSKLRKICKDQLDDQQKLMEGMKDVPKEKQEKMRETYRLLLKEYLKLC